MDGHRNPEFEKWWQDWVQAISQRNLQLNSATDEVTVDGEYVPEEQLMWAPWM